MVEITLGAPPLSKECNSVIHGVDLEFDDDVLNEWLKASGDVKTVGVKWRKYRGQPIETSVVTFKGKQIPEALTFGYVQFRVKEYVPRPIQCWCHYFSHVETRCQASIRCPTCE